jgi:hypothetical protein
MNTTTGVVRVKLARWICFTVLISLGPVLLDSFGLVLGKKAVSIEILLGAGQLFLIACSLAAAGIGELMGLGFRRATPVVAGWGCFLSAMGSAFAYAFIQNTKSDPKIAAYCSIITFLLTVTAATSCAVVSFRRGLRI